MPLTEADVREIAAKHGLKGEPEPMPPRGMVNEVWFIGDVVLRYAPDAEAVKDSRIEAEVVPMAVRAGVKTPELLHFEDNGETGYTLFPRVRGVNLGMQPADFERWAPCLREIGRNAAVLHRVRLSGPRPEMLSKPRLYDSFHQLKMCLDEGVLTADEGKGLAASLQRLQPLAEDLTDTLIHNDIHSWNVLADPLSGGLAAILDWGDGGYGHPAYDLAGMPIETTRWLLEGYREGGGQIDESFLATMLWQGTNVGLWEARKMTSTAIYDPAERAWWRWPLGGAEAMIRFIESLLENG